MIFKAIKDWVYCPDRFWFFTGANAVHTSEAESELERSGITVLKYDIYGRSYDFNPQFTLGLGKCSILRRLRIRFVVWMSGCKGRIWYAE